MLISPHRLFAAAALSLTCLFGFGCQPSGGHDLVSLGLRLTDRETRSRDVDFALTPLRETKKFQELDEDPAVPSAPPQAEPADPISRLNARLDRVRKLMDDLKQPQATPVNPVPPGPGVQVVRGPGEDALGLSSRELRELDAAVSVLEASLREIESDLLALKATQVAERKLAEERFQTLLGMIQKLEDRVQRQETQQHSSGPSAPVTGRGPQGYHLVDIRFACGMTQSWWVPPGPCLVTCPKCGTTSTFELKLIPKEDVLKVR